VTEEASQAICAKAAPTTTSCLGKEKQPLCEFLLVVDGQKSTVCKDGWVLVHD